MCHPPRVKVFSDTTTFRSFLPEELRGNISFFDFGGSLGRWYAPQGIFLSEGVLTTFHFLRWRNLEEKKVGSSTWEEYFFWRKEGFEEEKKKKHVPQKIILRSRKSLYKKRRQKSMGRKHLTDTQMDAYYTYRGAAMRLLRDGDYDSATQAANLVRDFEENHDLPASSISPASSPEKEKKKRGRPKGANTKKRGGPKGKATQSPSSSSGGEESPKKRGRPKGKAKSPSPSSSPEVQTSPDSPPAKKAVSQKRETRSQRKERMSRTCKEKGKVPSKNMTHCVKSRKERKKACEKRGLVLTRRGGCRKPRTRKERERFSPS